MREKKCIVNFMDLRFFIFYFFCVCFVSKVFRLDLYFILLNFGLFRGKLRIFFLGKLILFKPKNFLGTNVYKDVPNILLFGHNDV